VAIIDADRAPYSAITSRPGPDLTSAARMALRVVSNNEHDEYLPKPSPVRDPLPRTPQPP